MMKSIPGIIPALFMTSTLLYASNAFADYELSQNVLGYRMILTSQTRIEDDHQYIGFVQYENNTPPFILIETTSNDMIKARITSEIDNERLIGKIHFPANITDKEIKQLRINGYTILWKPAE